MDIYLRPSTLPNSSACAARTFGKVLIARRATTFAKVLIARRATTFAKVD